MFAGNIAVKQHKFPTRRTCLTVTLFTIEHAFCHCSFCSNTSTLQACTKRVSGQWLVDTWISWNCSIVTPRHVVRDEGHIDLCIHTPSYPLVMILLDSAMFDEIHAGTALYSGLRILRSMKRWSETLGLHNFVFDFWVLDVYFETPTSTDLSLNSPNSWIKRVKSRDFNVAFLIAWRLRPPIWWLHFWSNQLSVVSLIWASGVAVFSQIAVRGVSCQGECGWAWSPISLRCWDSCQNIHEGTMGTLPDVHCCVAIESDSEGWTNFQHLFGRLTNAKKKEVFVNSRKTPFSKSSERGFLDPWVAEQLPLGALIWTLWHCCGMGEYERWDKEMKV